MHVLVTLRALVPAQLGCCHVSVHFGNLALWDHSCALTVAVSSLSPVSVLQADHDCMTPGRGPHVTQRHGLACIGRHCHRNDTNIPF